MHRDFEEVLHSPWNKSFDNGLRGERRSRPLYTEFSIKVKGNRGQRPMQMNLTIIKSLIFTMHSLVGHKGIRAIESFTFIFVGLTYK